MKRNRIFPTFGTGGILLVGFLLAITGCGNNPGADEPGGAVSESAESEKDRYLVVFSQCNNAEPYRAAQNALMNDLFGEYPDVELVITDGQQDNAKQISQIETAIRQKPDLLIVAPNERKVRIEVGYGLEGDLPDAIARAIIDNDILPAFRRDDYPGGIEAGVSAIILAIEGAYEAAPEGTGQNRGGWLPILFIALIFGTMSFHYFLDNFDRKDGRWVRRRRPRRRSGSFYGFGGGRGSSGSGGGGFSGGGGSFGGGGSSGSW